MSRQWRPVVDESAQNSMAGSHMASNNGGNSRGLTGASSQLQHTSTRGLTTGTSNRTSTDQADYFRRPSMRSANTGTNMSEMSGASTNQMSERISRGVTRTDTGRTETYAPYGSQTGTPRTRTETTGISRNHSMKTTTTDHGTTHRTTGPTVSRNTSMSTTRTVMTTLNFHLIFL